jgi:virulence factor Mce-like protein
VLALLLIALCFYVAFVRQLPFSSSFVIRGVFSSANELKSGNPVRIAGLPVGTVTGIVAGPRGTSIVTMALSDHAGLHADATLSIKPRLLFEGNFYVNLDPGSPGAPALRSGDTVRLAQTSTPVQLDQLLDVLDHPTRSSLNHLLRATATGLALGGREAVAPPGFADLRAAARELGAALPPLGQIGVALQGVRAGDLRNAIGSASDTTSELARDPQALADLVASSDKVLAALAGGHQALAEDISGLDRFSHVAPAALRALDTALPVATEFARVLDPALTAAPPALSDLSGLFVQLHALAGAPALPRLVGALAPLLRVAPGLETRLEAAFPRLTELNICTRRNIVAALDTVLKDGSNTTGYPAWADLLHLGSALSGASASFDGNGVALRIGVAEGDQTASGLLPGFGQLTGKYQGEGVQPQWLGYGVVPPFRPDQVCDGQPLVQVNR